MQLKVTYNKAVTPSVVNCEKKQINKKKNVVNL